MDVYQTTAQDVEGAAAAALGWEGVAKAVPMNGKRRATRRPPLTPDQQGLAERYVPMARALARPLKAAWPAEWEEFESAALLALVEAAQSFDPSRNVKFATFAHYRIWGALRDVRRSLIAPGWRSRPEHAPAVSSLTQNAEEHGRVLGVEPAPPVGGEFEAADFVENWLRKLPPRHAAACREIYVHGRTQSEAAERLGCSKSRLSRLHKEAIDLLNDALVLDKKRRGGEQSP
jgi:RNA polymerase sigma factor (sigma-70 family)